MTKRLRMNWEIPQATTDERSLQYSTGAAGTWMVLASCSMVLGLTETGIRSFESAMRHEPDNARALLGLSQALRVNDLLTNKDDGCQQAIKEISLALERYPHLTSDVELCKELAECYLVVDMSEQAFQLVQRALQLKPEEAILWLLNAQALIRLDQYPTAKMSLIHCLSLFSMGKKALSGDDIEIIRASHAELAAIHASERNIELSIKELEATLSLPPPPPSQVEEHVALWCALATAKERANDIAGALQTCENAERILGSSARILITHAYLLMINNDKNGAEMSIALLEEVLRNEEKNSQEKINVKEESDLLKLSNEGDYLPCFLLGKAYSILDQPRLAYDSYQLSLRRAPNSPISWLAVGRLYLQLKQLPDALAAYSQALRLQIDEVSLGTAVAWVGLSFVYEFFEDQLMDAADACGRAAECFRIIEDIPDSQFFHRRSMELAEASKGKGTVPVLQDFEDVPNVLLRDLVALLPSERIAQFQENPSSAPVKSPGQQPTPRSQSNHEIDVGAGPNLSQKHQKPAAPKGLFAAPQHGTQPPPFPWSPHNQPNGVPQVPVVQPGQPGQPPYYYLPPVNGVSHSPVPNQMMQPLAVYDPQMSRNGGQLPVPVAYAPGSLGPPTPPQGIHYAPFYPLQREAVYNSSVNGWRT